MKHYIFLFLLVFTFQLTQGQVEKDNKVYLMAEEQPQFPEGNRKFIIKNLRYDRRNEFPESKVSVEFIVEKDGSLSNIKILKGNMDKEFLINALENSPKWIVGKNRGKVVRVKMSFPISCIKWN